MKIRLIYNGIQFRLLTCCSNDSGHLVNNKLSCTYVCGLSNSELVEVDCLCRPVTDNDYLLQNGDGDDTELCPVLNSDVGGSNVSLFGDVTNNFSLESNNSVEEATEKMFRLGDMYVLSTLKIMAHQFDMK